MKAEPSRAESGSFWRSTTWVVAVHAGGLFTVGLVLGYVVPEFERAFTELEIHYPSLTDRIFEASDILYDNRFLFLAAAAVALACDGVLYHALRRSGRERLAGALRIGVMLLELGAITLVVAGLFETVYPADRGADTVNP